MKSLLMCEQRRELCNDNSSSAQRSLSATARVVQAEFEDKKER